MRASRPSWGAAPAALHCERGGVHSPRRAGRGARRPRDSNPPARRGPSGDKPTGGRPLRVDRAAQRTGTCCGALWRRRREARAHLVSPRTAGISHGEIPPAEPAEPVDGPSLLHGPRSSPRRRPLDQPTAVCRQITARRWRTACRTSDARRLALAGTWQREPPPPPWPPGGPDSHRACGIAPAARGDVERGARPTPASCARSKTPTPRSSQAPGRR